MKHSQLSYAEVSEMDSGNSKKTGQFKKGQSGNPSGRPKKTIQLAEKCRDMSADALKQIMTILQTGKPSEQLKAAEIILAYGYGKPSQKLEHAGVPNEPLVFTWSTSESDEK